MKLCTPSHLDRHATVNERRTILNILRIKGMAKVEYIPTLNPSSKGGTYYAKRKARLFCPTAALEYIKTIKPSSRAKDYNYKRLEEILEMVIEDRGAYGDKVPNTTDIWEDLYVEKEVKVKVIGQKAITQHNNLMRNRAKSRTEFKLKFHNYNWGKHLSKKAS